MITECIYCNREVEESETVPGPHDDEAWRKLAAQHNPACEWALTRAHTRDEPTDVTTRRYTP
jgi:hypothetical protein